METRVKETMGKGGVNEERIVLEEQMKKCDDTLNMGIVFQSKIRAYITMYLLRDTMMADTLSNIGMLYESLWP